MGLTHFDNKGNAWMVDVGEKPDTQRIAIASGCIYMNTDTFAAVKGGTAKKGDVLGVARIAGIMGAKKNSELIPLCHPIPMTHCELDFELDDAKCMVKAVCTATTVGKTGIEMEAMTGVSIALLTIYDMCKAMDRSMLISDICLQEKDGGKSGHYVRKED